MEAVLTTKTVSPFDPLTPNSLTEWPRQNFSLQYQYNIKQTSVENKEKYQLQDYKLIQNQILKTKHHKNGMEDSKENY